MLLIKNSRGQIDQGGHNQSRNNLFHSQTSKPWSKVSVNFTKITDISHDSEVNIGESKLLIKNSRGSIDRGGPYQSRNNLFQPQTSKPLSKVSINFTNITTVFRDSEVNIGETKTQIKNSRGQKP
jgi:hypothetical protein